MVLRTVQAVGHKDNKTQPDSGQLDFNTRDGLVLLADHTGARGVEFLCSRARATTIP